jgi:hypothetical protein
MQEPLLQPTPIRPFSLAILLSENVDEPLVKSTGETQELTNIGQLPVYVFSDAKRLLVNRSEEEAQAPIEKIPVYLTLD